jgi:hypothetical protein
MSQLTQRHLKKDEGRRLKDENPSPKVLEGDLEPHQLLCHRVKQLGGTTEPKSVQPSSFTLHTFVEL